MIPLFKVAMSEAASDRVNTVLQSGYIGQGPEVEAFEEALRDHLGAKHLVTLNSCTSALHLAFHLLKDPAERIGAHGPWPGINPGDEVLSCPLTCTATNWPVLANGFDLKWVDVDPGNANIDLDDLERKITSRTKAVIVVHWGGYAVDLGRLSGILDRAQARLGFRPVVIEDCAHAWRATYRNQLLGTHGNFCVFSFQAIKHLTCGDGGLLVLPDEEFSRRAKLLRWYGIDRDEPRGDLRCENDVVEWGFKFHMNDINAAIGLANLELARECVARHRRNAAFYDQELASLPGVSLLDYQSDRDSSYWIYTLKVDRRDDFARHMAKAEVMVSRVHERNDNHTTVQRFRTPLRNLDSFSAQMICIPVGWWVGDDERAHIVQSIKAGW